MFGKEHPERIISRLNVDVEATIGVKHGRVFAILFQSLAMYHEHRYHRAIFAWIEDLVGHKLVAVDGGHLRLLVDMDTIGRGTKVVSIDDARRKVGGDFVEELGILGCAMDGGDMSDGRVHIEQMLAGGQVVHLDGIDHVHHVDGHQELLIHHQCVGEHRLLTHGQNVLPVFLKQQSIW